MDSILIAIVICLLVANLVAVILLFKRKQPDQLIIARYLKTKLVHLKNSFSQSFGSMSKEIAKDMTGSSN